ncbi:MAG: transporter substrate-binding domain-containing protein [Deltaproteobacteria bacterium]|nr:transporter substrate-binding domain-containing protein [Deltaproteobacteria bacterium]
MESLRKFGKNVPPLLLLLLALGADAEDRVRVGVSGDYPPYAYVDAAGEPAGFNVDLLRAMGKAAGFELELRAGAWNELKEGLRSGELDALASMLRSEKREAWVDFSTPILDVEYAIFVRKGTRGIDSLESLRGRAVLAQAGSLMHEFLIDRGMGDQVIPVESEPEALRILDQGQFVAAVVPYRQGLEMAAVNDLRAIEVAGPPIHSTGLCFAVRKGDDALLRLLNEELAKLRASGQFQEIYSRHFSGRRSTPGQRPTPEWLGPASGLALLLGVATALLLWRRRGGSRPRGPGMQAGTDAGVAGLLGSYELIEKIGSGGAGDVWRARHTALSRPAAVKRVRIEQLRGDAESVEAALIRFEREARATAALRSPHTIELYDYGRAEDGSVYYAMELLEGLDLQSLVERFGRLPPARIVHLMRQACDSLEEAHHSGLLHRDIKPANIFACHLGTAWDVVKVLDFGLVKLQGVAAAANVELTTGDMVQGTPLCIAPEIVLGEDEVDERADIYSLGCVGYWLLAGRPVFETDNPIAMAVAHATEPVIPPSERVGEALAPGLEALILACLAKTPDARPASAAALSARLEACPVPDTWSGEMAKAWWQTHLPELDQAKSSAAARVLAETR